MVKAALQATADLRSDCTVSSIVHGLYAFRISVLYQRRWIRDMTIGLTLAMLIMLLSSAQWACCMVAAIYNALQSKQGPGKRFIARKFFRVWLVIATVDDILISTSATKSYTPLSQA